MPPVFKKQILANLGLAFFILTLCPDVFSEIRVVKNVAYLSVPGSDLKLNTLDIYAPSTGTEHPVIIWVHGGGWQTGDKAPVYTKAKRFTHAGFVFISVNYRLSPAVKHPVHVQDVATATAWVYAHAADYGVNPNRIFLMGHSSGAHLAALVATDDRYLKAAGADLRILKGCIALDSGSYDIPAMLAEAPRYRSFVEAAFGNNPEAWKAASPTAHVMSGKFIPPFLLIHAGKLAATRHQAQQFAGLLDKAGVSVEIRHAVDKYHSSLDRDLGSWGDEPTKWILDFMDHVLEEL